MRAPHTWAAALLLSWSCFTRPPAPHCHIAQPELSTTVRPARLDLLFVVDTSPGMQPHLERLRAEIPRLFAALTEGHPAHAAYGNLGLRTFWDVHMAVVSGDLGLGGVAAEGCSAHGAAGVLSNAAGCSAGMSGFTWYYKHLHDPAAALAQLECQLSAAGSSCPVTQPLEAALTALWPFPSQGEPLAASAGAVHGHGDGKNLGFLRDPRETQLLIVVVTNQDDCSLLEPPELASTTEPPVEQVLRRCREKPERLAALARYIEALGTTEESANRRHLAPSIVLIAGVPPDLTSLARSDLPSTRPAQIDAILSDPRMQWRAARDGLGFEPSCRYRDAAAFPPRRLLELAKHSDGQRMVVGSICEDDLLAAVYRWDALERHAWSSPEHTGELCAPSDVARDAFGRAPCTMTWELPRSRDPARPTAIVSCDERPELLSTARDPHRRVGPHGGAVCEVRQLALPDPTRALRPERGDGFYLAARPSPTCGRRFTYTPHAWPPEGTLVTVQCKPEFAFERDSWGKRLASNADADKFESLGNACDAGYVHRDPSVLPELREGDELCGSPRLGETSNLICHPVQHICVMKCRDSADCPTGWVCDRGSTPLSASAGTRICVQPPCEGD